MEEAIHNTVIICKALSKIIPKDSAFEWDVGFNGHFLIVVRYPYQLSPYEWTLDSSLKTGQRIHQKEVVQEFPNFTLTMKSIENTLKVGYM